MTGSIIVAADKNRLGKSLFPLLPPPSLPLRVQVCPPTPLSPSSSGLAGRSDWERGSRTSCIACSLGLARSSGALPCCLKPALTGGVGRRRGRSPLWRPWRTAVRDGSSRSASNKPGFLEGSWSLSRGPEIRLQARRGDEVGGGPVTPAAGGLDLDKRLPGSRAAAPPCPPSTPASSCPWLMQGFRRQASLPHWR
jgi:hypothetical protein